MRRLADLVVALSTGRALRWVIALAVLVAGTVVGVEATGGSATYPLTAVFARAPGLFPGASVQVLGVPEGTVTSVRNVGDRVVVGMAIDAGRPVPAAADASLVSPQLLGEPDIELGPGYTGGPVLRPGGTIPESRTAEPVSINQLLTSLQRTLGALDPHAVGGLITNLATDLSGQARGLNQLIAGAAGTLQLLAKKEDDLGQLSGTLAQLTGTLDSRNAQITQLIDDYDTVSGVIAQHGGQLGDAITQLDQASSSLVGLLTPNLAPLEHDVGTITTVGRTLDRNLTAIDNGLGSANALFSAAGRAYDPSYNWLNLNVQLPAGVTGAYLAGLVRDRLAGVCRRIAANHSQGLSAAQLATLQQCGNPASGFFDPIVNQFPTILNDLSHGTTPAPTSPATMLQQGLAEIPGVPSSSSPAAGGAPTSGSSPPSSTTTTTQPGSSGSGSSGSGGTICAGGVLAPILGCSPSSTTTTTTTPPGSSGSGSSGSGSSGSGLGGLLAYHHPVGGGPTAAPSLEAPAAAMLPRAPPVSPRPSHHRGRGVLGTVGHWVHDLWSWL
ncbi:MAG: MCE family protein [Acidimicrobiales bacterium]